MMWISREANIYIYIHIKTQLVHWFFSTNKILAEIREGFLKAELPHQDIEAYQNAIILHAGVKPRHEIYLTDFDKNGLVEEISGGRKWYTFSKQIIQKTLYCISSCEFTWYLYFFSFLGAGGGGGRTGYAQILLIDCDVSNAFGLPQWMETTSKTISQLGDMIFQSSPAISSLASFLSKI